MQSLLYTIEDELEAAAEKRRSGLARSSMLLISQLSAALGDVLGAKLATPANLHADRGPLVS